MGSDLVNKKQMDLLQHNDLEEIIPSVDLMSAQGYLLRNEC